MVEFKMITDMEDRFTAAELLNKKNQAREAFSKTSRKAFSKLTDEELALTQSYFEVGDPQYIIAEHEWNVRILARELRSIRYGTWATLVGTFGGVILGWLLK